MERTGSINRIPKIFANHSKTIPYMKMIKSTTVGLGLQQVIKIRLIHMLVKYSTSKVTLYMRKDVVPVEQSRKMMEISIWHSIQVTKHMLDTKFMCLRWD